MTAAVPLLAAAAGLLALLEAVPALLLMRAALRSRAAPTPATPLPKAMVVLCLRGADAELRRCLEALLQQDYPDYLLQVVVDSEADPAWEVIRSLIGALTPAQRQRIRAENLRDPSPHCSLKCSALLQALRAPGPDIRAVAFIDADTVPPPDWLRRLVAPLGDDRVGAVSGGRWYRPRTPRIAALARGAWNAAAQLQMYWFGIAWGGSMAIRRELLDQPALARHWSQAFGEDTALDAVLRETGLRLQQVPSLALFNDGDCSLGECFDWMHRQLLSARLHHRCWPLVPLHAALVVGVLGSACGVAAAIAATQGVAAAYPLLLALAGYELLQLVLLLMGDRIAASCAGMVLREGRAARAGRLARLLLALPLAQCLHLAAVVRAWRTREVAWRGVRYRIDRMGGLLRLDPPPAARA